MADPVSIMFHRRYVYMLPTGSGFLFGFSTLAMLLVATNYSNGLAHGFCFLLAGVVIVSMLYTQRNLQGLKVSAVPAAAVFAGQHARFPVIISTFDQIPRLSLWLEKDAQPVAFSVQPGEPVRRNVSVMTTRRGRVSIPVVRVASTYPLGLFLAWSRRIELAGDCIVFPEPSAPLPFPNFQADRPVGNAVVRSDGDDFQGFREYRTGDSYRHIHWKSLPRGNSLQLKTFAASHDRECWFDLMHTPGPGLERQLSQLCRWIIDAEVQQLHYGLRLGSVVLAPNTGQSHKLHCLKLLALYPLTD